MAPAWQRPTLSLLSKAIVCALMQRINFLECSIICGIWDISTITALNSAEVLQLTASLLENRKAEAEKVLAVAS